MIYTVSFKPKNIDEIQRIEVDATDEKDAKEKAKQKVSGPVGEISIMSVIKGNYVQKGPRYFDALIELKEELFDAPKDVKENFNTIIQYFSAIDESRIAKILNKQVRKNNPEFEYMELLKSSTPAELENWIKTLDGDLMKKLLSYSRYDSDELKDRFIKRLKDLNSKKTVYAVLVRYLDYEEGSYHYDIDFLNSEDVKKLYRDVNAIEKSSKIFGNFSSDLKKLMAKYSKKVTPENADDMMEVLGAEIAKISSKSKSRRGIAVGSALRYACQYSNAEDAYWNDLDT